MDSKNYLCHSCEARTLLVWNDETGFATLGRKMKTLPVIELEGEIHAVRCNFFKMFVPAVDQLKECGAYRERSE